MALDLLLDYLLSHELIFFGISELEVRGFDLLCLVDAGLFGDVLANFFNLLGGLRRVI